jgi:hypothetical protein
MLYLENATTYEFRVLSTNISGVSTPSNVASARPMPPFPQAPGNLSHTFTESAWVNLTWTASPTPRVYYYIYYRKGSGRYSRVAYPTTNTTATVYVEWGNVYEFYVTAINQAGESSGSPHVFVRVGPTDGTWRCPTASGSRVSLGSGVPAQIKHPHPSATACGYRDGSRMNFIFSWNTSNHLLVYGAFHYEVTDCQTGQLVYEDDSQSFFVGLDNPRSWTGSGWINIDWTHYYRVRVWGSGYVHAVDQYYAFFSSNPDSDPQFDAWSSCF